MNIREKLKALNDRWPSLAILAVMLILILLYFDACRSRDKYEKIIHNTVSRSDLQRKTMQDHEREFLEKMRTGRYVYQWQVPISKMSKVGKVYVRKKYAMNLPKYNSLMKECFWLNRCLGIPLDARENYFIPGKLILESAINEKAKHKTGEIMHLTGYTPIGYADALMRYRDFSKIEKGHRFYIVGIYDRHPDYKRLFSNNWQNIIKFDYAYMYWLLSQHGGKWDFALTTFHFGASKAQYWKDKKLARVPDYRLDGKWKGYYLREYFETIEEIAHGLHVGQLTRISRWKERVGRIKRRKKYIETYIKNFKLSARRQQSAEELEKKLEAVTESYKQYRKLNERLAAEQAKLNDLVLDEKRAISKKRKAALKKKVRAAQKMVLDAWMLLKGKKVKKEIKRGGKK